MGLDEPIFAARLDRALRERGVEAGTRRAATLAQVLRKLPPRSREGLYWRARVSMLPSIDDAAAFDAAFAACTGSDDLLRQFVEPGGPPHTEPPAAVRREGAPAPSPASADDAHAADAPIQWLLASSEARYADRDFDQLDDDERAAIGALAERVRVAAEYRESRRRRAHPRGDRFDFRGTLRGASRTAGELIRWRSSRRRRRVRPLVFLLDVSGSMDAFARPLLHYARAAALARPHVRALTFATDLSDLTPILKRAGDAVVMEAIAGAVRDYGGGTRIGAALHAFNDRYAQRGAARGGTVVILSDGWEREDPRLVGLEMQRLRRLARRIVWVNPHKRHPAYEPLARGMAAALPYLDAFVAGHNLRTLEAVADAVEGRIS